MYKILINGLQLSNTNTGVQYYTQQLYKELIKLETENFKFHLLQYPRREEDIAKNNRLYRILTENFFIPTYLHKNNCTLYHSTNYVLPFFFNSPSVLTLHDLITLDFPELCQTESVVYFKLLLDRSIKKATKIIAVSKTVKNDILKHFKVADEKIEVVYHGINTIFKKNENSSIAEKTRKKYELPEKFVLFVGNIEPKKNLENVLQAFYLLKKNTELKHKLIIVGKKGWKYKPVFSVIDQLKIHSEIIFTGYVPEEDLPAIYSMADLFVFPSLYEGFGFPPLEALACKVPVIVSNKGALPEITGGKCLQVNPYNVKEIEEGMFKLLTDTDLREKSIEQGSKWIKQFSWEKAAKETLMVYEQALINKNS